MTYTQTIVLDEKEKLVMMNYPNMKVLYSTQELNHLNMKMSLT